MRIAGRCRGGGEVVECCFGSGQRVFLIKDLGAELPGDAGFLCLLPGEGPGLLPGGVGFSLPFGFEIGLFREESFQA